MHKRSARASVKPWSGAAELTPFVQVTPFEMRLRRAAILSAAILSACGCFFGQEASHSGAASAWSGEIPLQVVNHHWLDVTIYVIHDGQRTRLGVASGSAQTRMMLPHRLLGVGRELQLYGDPIGSLERAITEVVVVQPGQFIEWLLEADLARSTVGVY
jgi:hypothetical protein